MKLLGLATVLAALLTASAANAMITDWQCQDDGDGAVTMGPMTWSHDAQAQEYTLRITEVQHWGPAHLGGSFTTDSPLDPTVWILKDVENQTTFVWNDYHFNIFMMQPFNITAAVGPVGWTNQITLPSGGTWYDSHGNPWSWWGAVDFYSSAPTYDIPIGGWGSFGARVSFMGSVSFEVEQIPTPEPASLALLALGGLFLRRRR